jgi:hypothetical protein
MLALFLFIPLLSTVCQKILLQVIINSIYNGGGDNIMRKIIELIVNAIKSFKTSMDQYGEARIIVSASMANDYILRKITKTKKQFNHYIL